MGADGFDRFTWTDGSRVVMFGRGLVAEGLEQQIDQPYVILSTERSIKLLPEETVERAVKTLYVPAGSVAEAASRLTGGDESDALVAVGGGRVIDTAKALAATRETATVVVAVPTTLSGAEMTSLHQQSGGANRATKQVRPQMVMNDPALSASQPHPERSASTANSFSHAIEAVLTERANPVATMVAIRAGGLLAEGSRNQSSDDLALGALYAGYAIDSAGYGIHHVLAQTVARELAVPHSAANAVLLPHSIEALTARYPSAVADFDLKIGSSSLLAAHAFASAAGATRLRDFGAEYSELSGCAELAATRPQLEWMQPRASKMELQAILASAW